MKIFGKFLIAFALFSLIIPGYLSNMDNANADYIDKFSLRYVLEPLTDSQIKDCESIHDDFTSLSDFDFYTRYQTNNFAGNCVMLYEDSLWDYEGSDRYEILSERSFELIQEREAKLKQSRENFYIESKSLTELGIPGTFLFIFEGCTGSQTINLNEVYLVSDIETVPFTTFENQEREIPPGVCNLIERQIRADDPNSIKVVIPSLGLEVPVKLDEQIADVVTIEVSVPSKYMISRGDLSHKATSLDEKNMKECENIYPDFQKFDENNFNTRYLYHEFVGDCVLLFEDPIWETRDSSNIDEINQRLDELRKQKEISRIGDEFKPFSITPMSIEKISDNLYIYSFEGCTGDEAVNIENAVIASDTEILSLVNQKREGNLLHPGICQVLDIAIRADDPSSIKIVLPMMSNENMLPVIENQIEIPEVVEETTMPEVVEEEMMETESTDEVEGGGCLIATATYGSELAPQVQQLRELRDNSLLNTESGTSFMGTFNDFYYSFSPVIADYERENPVFKEMVKIAITPMISSLSILNYVDMDSEVEVLGYGISLILLNVGMYVGIPAIVIIGIRKKF